MLDTSLNIADVATLQETLKCYVDSDQDLTLDGSQVESIDTVSMQLFVAFVRQLESNNCVIIWQEPSAAICKTAELLGLGDDLSLDEFLA